MTYNSKGAKLLRAVAKEHGKPVDMDAIAPARLDKLTRDSLRAIREDQAIERKHKHDARVFLTEHPASGVEPADHFRKELAAEIENGLVTPESAATQLEEELIEDVFEKQGDDRN